MIELNGRSCRICGLIVKDINKLEDGLCTSCKRQDKPEDIIQYVDRISKERKGSCYVKWEE